MIDTRDQQIVKEELRTVSVAVYDDADGENDIMGTANKVLCAGLKLRGASSYNFDKNQYRMKFYRDEAGKAMDYGLLGMGADSEWVLNGPYLDHSLLRNYLMYTLSREIMDWAPDCRFLELFVDGRYQGVYLATEPVTVGPNRLALSEYGLLSGATPYLVARDRKGTQIHAIDTYGTVHGLAGNEIGIRYPSRYDLTEEQKVWIQEDVSRFEQALYSDYFDDPARGYERFIDVDSFADYLILNEFSMNYDAFNLSTYVYKELNGKMKLAVWDFNNTFNNYQFFTMETDEFSNAENYWVERMLQDRNFVDRVVERYWELRENELSDAHIKQLLYAGRDYLGPAIDRNFQRWNYTLHTNMLAGDGDGIQRDPESYEEAFNRLRRTIIQRVDFLDHHLGDLYKNCIN